MYKSVTFSGLFGLLTVKWVLPLFMLMVRSYFPCLIVAANYDGNRFFTLQEGVKKVSHDGLGQACENILLLFRILLIMLSSSVR